MGRTNFSLSRRLANIKRVSSRKTKRMEVRDEVWILKLGSILFFPFPFSVPNHPKRGYRSYKEIIQSLHDVKI
jgi:hypothetical protein